VAVELLGVHSARLRSVGTRVLEPQLKAEVRAYMADLGRRGGQTTGFSKVRGDREYYRRIARKAVKARKLAANQALTK
jgi:general stress protein YciG